MEMKINVKDIEKVNNKIENIDGWEVKSMKSWQTKTGKDMITVQLVKDTEDGPPLRPTKPGNIPQPSNVKDSMDIAKENREIKIEATILKKKVNDKSGSSTTIVETDDDVEFKFT